MIWCCSLFLSSQPGWLPLEGALQSVTCWDASGCFNYLFRRASSRSFSGADDAPSSSACCKPFPLAGHLTAPRSPPLPHLSPGNYPLSNEQVADAEHFLWSFFNVIIIYCVNIHCSYIDNRLQSTGVYSDSLPEPSPSPSGGAGLRAPSPAVPCCSSGHGGGSTRERTGANGFGCTAAQDNQPVAVPSFPSPALPPQARADTPTPSPWISVGVRGAQHHLKSCTYSVKFPPPPYLQSAAQIQHC